MGDVIILDLTTSGISEAVREALRQRATLPGIASIGREVIALETLRREYPEIAAYSKWLDSQAKLLEVPPELFGPGPNCRCVIPTMYLEGPGPGIRPPSHKELRRQRMARKRRRGYP